MAKQAKREPKAAPTQGSAANAFFIGVICLVLGFAGGYYFGQSTDTPAATASPSAQAPGPVANTAVMVQQEAGLKAMLQSNPSDLNALIRLGDLYYDTGRPREAVDYYGRALEIDPTNVNVRTDRGTSYWNLGQADAAVAEFNKSLEYNPSHPQTLYNLGVVSLHGKNDAGAARKAWETLLATNPNYPEAARVREVLASLPASGEMPGVGAPQEGQSLESLMNQLKKK